ncbi:MAG: glycosyltransferase [Spirochaetia bacterium]|jgi:processive 1,2-diacylglycerol beta-glucosyltransferase
MVEMKRIDIYTIDIGGGHIAPAVALKEQFDILGYKDLDVRVVNLGIALGASFLRYLYKFYWNNALRYPPLINAFYRGADNPFMIKIIDRILGITILPKFVRYLERERPDLVVSTYFTFTHYLELLKQVGQLDAVSVVLNPEPFDSHYIWFSPVFDWSMVFSRKSRDEIIEKGIWARKVKVFQFPIKPSFSPHRESRTVLRRRLELAQKPFTVLFFFGAEGVGPVKKILATLIQRGLAIQAVVICGRNERLRTDIEALAKGATGALQINVRGYVTNVAEYISAADVVVGKSGPNQVFETLVQGRPLIISSFLANEKETTSWVIGNKLGWLTRTPAHLATLLAKLAANPTILESYQQNIRRMNLRSGAPEICDFLYGLVKNTSRRKKQTVGDALRRFRDAVVAEGEAISRRIDASEGIQRLKRAASSRRV